MNKYQEWEDSLDRNYLEQLDPSAFELAPCAFEAGAQSKQAEIDELRKQLDIINQYTAAQGEAIKICNDERLESRKRIDESLLIVERMAKATNSTAMWAFDLDKALKGTTNEK
jgi:hypothetical protein